MAARAYYCAACGVKLKPKDVASGKAIYSHHTRSRYCPATEDKACQRRAKKLRQANGKVPPTSERPQEAATKGGAVSTTATDTKKKDEAPKAAAPPKEKEPVPSIDELRATMSKNQKGYDAYCELRDEMKGANKATTEQLKAKQAKHKKAFQAWKKAYKLLRKEHGVGLRALRDDKPADEPAKGGSRKALQEKADEAKAPEPEAEPAPAAS